MTDDNSRLKIQRIIIVIAVVLALLFAVGNIVNSMQDWSDTDEATQEDAG